MTKDAVHGVGHSPVCQILLQIVVRAVIISSPPAWTSSAGMLSTPADFHFVSDCTAASSPLGEGGGGHPVCLSGNSEVQMDLHWPCDYTAQCSILSIPLQTAVVWSCLPFIRSGQKHLARHSERGKKTRQTEEEVERHHQGMNRPGVRQVPEGSGEQKNWRKLVAIWCPNDLRG